MRLPTSCWIVVIAAGNLIAGCAPHADNYYVHAKLVRPNGTPLALNRVAMSEFDTLTHPEQHRPVYTANDGQVTYRIWAPGTTRVIFSAPPVPPIEDVWIWVEQRPTSWQRIHASVTAQHQRSIGYGEAEVILGQLVVPSQSTVSQNVGTPSE